MNFKNSVILTVIASMALVASGNVFPEHDSGFFKLMARSNDVMRNDPFLALECFDQYNPKFKEIGDEYKKSYAACLDKSAGDRSAAEDETLAQRQDLASGADQSCQALAVCKESKSAEEELKCFKEGGSQGAKVMYDINNNATTFLNNLLEVFRVITFNENKCTNESKVAYERDFGITYDKFEDCLLGIAPAEETTKAPTDAPTNAPTDAPTNAPTEAPTNAPTQQPEAPEDQLPEEDLTLLQRLLSSARIHKLKL